MSRGHHNGSRTGAARALGALTRLLGSAAALLKRDHGAIQDPPTGICEAEYRSAEPTAGLHETRSTRKQRGQGRRVDRHEDMDMAGKMSEIDMQGASGHEDAQSQRKATGTRCSPLVGVNSKSGELPERVPINGHERVERTSDRTKPARSPEPKWWQSFRAGAGARSRRLVASLLLAMAASAFGAPALAQTTVPSNWSLKPSALTGGDQFRLLFLSSTKRNASATGYRDLQHLHPEPRCGWARRYPDL